MERLYRCKYWTKRLPEDQLLPEHIRIITEESLKNKGKLVFDTISYGPSDHEKIDIFKGSKPALLIYFSGGYWQAYSGDISAHGVEPFVQHGIHTAIVDYDRAPKVTVSQIVQQALEATKKLLEFAKTQEIHTGAKTNFLSKNYQDFNV